MSAADDIRTASPELIAKIETIREQLESGDGKLEMDKLAEKGVEFRAVMDFLQWASGQGSEMGMKTPYGFVALGVRHENLVGTWLGIDIGTVELERAEFIRQYSDGGSGS